MRTIRVLATATAVLATSVGAALAQAGGGGTGGAEQHPAGTPKGNENPSLPQIPGADKAQAGLFGLPLLAGIFPLDLPPDGSINVGDKGIAIRHPDVLLRIGGRLHLDAGAAATNSPAFALAFQSTLIRRAFIESYLTIDDKVEFAFQYDTAPNQVQPLQDAGVSYRGPGPFMLSLGNLKEPMGFAQLTSDNDTLFLERPLPTGLTPGRNFGGLFGVNGTDWTFVAGVWGGDPNTGLTDEGVSSTARATWAPILTDVQVLHLGVSGSYRELDRDSPRFAFETTVARTPETALLPAAAALLNTGTIAGADAIERVGLEFAYQYGSIRLQAEANRQADTRVAAPDAVFTGAYAEIGWVLNGNGRPYRLKPSYGSEYAEFGGVEVPDYQQVSHGGIGVFEIGARESYLDLSSHNVRGGSERDFTLGLNWYPERNIRLVGNYIHVDSTPSATTPMDTNADIVAGRLQFYW